MGAPKCNPPSFDATSAVMADGVHDVKTSRGHGVGSAATQALQGVLTRSGCELALLFGSVASGRDRAGSDVDIGVLFGARGVPSLRDRLALAVDLDRACGRDVDLVVLDDAPPLLRHEASKGVLLCETRRGAHGDFCARALLELDDVRPLIRRTATPLLRRGAAR